MGALEILFIIIICFSEHYNFWNHLLWWSMNGAVPCQQVNINTSIKISTARRVTWIYQQEELASIPPPPPSPKEKLPTLLKRNIHKSEMYKIQYAFCLILYTPVVECLAWKPVLSALCPSWKHIFKNSFIVAVVNQMNNRSFDSFAQLKNKFCFVFALLSSG